MIYLKVGYITVIVIVGYTVGLLFERYQQNKIKELLLEDIMRLKTKNEGLLVSIQSQKKFMNTQADLIDKLKWDNAEKDIVKHKIDSYKKGIAYEYK